MLAANSDFPTMKNAAKTIGKRLFGMLNAMRHGVSHGNSEALNNKIRLLRIKAWGDRNRESLAGSDLPRWETEYGVLSLPTMIGEDEPVHRFV